MARAAKREHAGEVVSLGALFAAFLKVSLFGVGGGGGLVWARRIGVEQRQWITEGEFADIVSLCQFMPGPNIIGIAVCTGARLRGRRRRRVPVDTVGRRLHPRRGPSPARAPAG